MFQTKARRFFPILALTAALCLSPLASASAETADASEDLGLLAQIGAQIVSAWDALLGTRTDEESLFCSSWSCDVGPRMDDNG